MPTLGVHTHITNPLSAGYLSYLLAICSWAEVADEVVVVDGGSTDGSLELLLDWTAHLGNVRVVSPASAYWPAGDGWYWPQIAINRTLGLQALETDWAIHIDADHVKVASVTRHDIDVALHRHSDSAVLSFSVSDPRSLSRGRRRAWVVNRSKDRTVTYGLDSASVAHLDYPVSADQSIAFRDADSITLKSYVRGPLVPAEGDLGHWAMRLGHYFFTPKQCLAKCRRLDRALARFCGRVPASPTTLAALNSIATSGMGLTDLPLLDSGLVQRVQADFDLRSILGIAAYPAPRARQARLSLRSLSARTMDRAVTLNLRRRGLVGGYKLESPNAAPLDVGTLCRYQDRVYRTDRVASTRWSAE